MWCMRLVWVYEVIGCFHLRCFMSVGFGAFLLGVCYVMAQLSELHVHSLNTNRGFTKLSGKPSTQS